MEEHTVPHPRYPRVFTPIRIGTTSLRNRIFVPAHTTNYGENNLPSARHTEYHRARAAGGVALIVFEAIRVHESSLGRRQGVNGYEPQAIPRFRAVARAVQAEGAKLFGQIIHLGRHIDGNYTRTPAWGASPLPWSATAAVPHAMTPPEIDEVTRAHATVARNLLDAGLDGIEVTLGHGHLLQQFMSPASNVREDAYGGSFENRLRFPLATLLAVREAVGRDATVGIRISADEFLPGGLGPDEVAAIVRHLAGAVPLDFVHVSHSAYHGSYTMATQMADMSFPKDSFRHLPARIRAGLDRPLPLFGVCLVRSVDDAEAFLATGDVAMVGMARAHIADPALVTKARRGREADTIPCIGCNQGCAGSLALGLPITCITNPAAGREVSRPEPSRRPAATAREVLVVGGGPAGLEAAATAAARGHRVSLWEAGRELGGELRWLETMPLRREFMALVDAQLRRLERGKVRVDLGRATTVDAIRAHGAERVVIATGAEPRSLTLRQGGRTLTLQEAIARPEALGRRVVLVDLLGTWAIAGTAEWLADCGMEVTLMVPTGVPAWTVSIYSSFALRHRLRRKRVAIAAHLQPIRFESGLLEAENLTTGDTVRFEAGGCADSPAPRLTARRARPRLRCRPGERRRCYRPCRWAMLWPRERHWKPFSKGTKPAGRGERPVLPGSPRAATDEPPSAAAGCSLPSVGLRLIIL